ncbi:DUF4123 domain-containing protein [Alphaproteobacteria bacterium KMM 3653]|uniref:DUF4123 domain-containing protein n=1 Tax=Harenicola maris TaxID=2841044 RepID=A0AAP2CR39_9RHOB|nr:DUF4123 domain-containing protein [Harenicola maris]
MNLASGDAEDYWAGAALKDSAGEASHPQPELPVQIIEGVEHLDAQFGVQEPQNVPTALRDALFGRPKQIEGHSPLPLKTYAILDAAKVMGLPETLEASGLEHACLFKGKAAGELRDVAPYLVRLEESHSFTRNLFTKGPSVWHMWDRQPGIYLRSTEDFQKTWKHFRKFIKAQDYTGRWLYLRFWEPSTFGVLSKIDRSSEPWLTRLLRAHRFIWPDVSKDGHHWFEFEMDSENLAAKGKIVIGRHALDALDAAVREQHAAEDIRSARAYLQRSDQSLEVCENHLGSVRSWLLAHGFRQRKVLVSTMQAIAEKFPADVQPPDALLRLLSDKRKGAALRLWHVENWPGPEQ